MTEVTIIIPNYNGKKTFGKLHKDTRTADLSGI